MRRLRRSIGIGAALSFLLLGAPIDGAGAAPEDTPAPQGEQASARRAVVEPTGRGASVSAMRSGKLRCGDRITQTTTLTADVGPCAGNGIIIGADNIMLNLNGHTVFGTPGPSGGNAAGIRLPNRAGVTVTGQPGNSGRKGTVTGFDAGLVINGGSGNTIENLDVRDNVGPNDPNTDLGDGIFIFDSSNNRIMGNSVIGNGIYDGIGVWGFGSSSNMIDRNEVAQTRGAAGFYNSCFPGTGTGIIVNPFIGDDFDDPRRSQSVHNNTISNNLVRRNGNAGISSVSNVDGQIVGNVVEENGFVCLIPGNGIGVSSLEQATRLTRNVVRDNRSMGNNKNGIEIRSHQNIIESNVALGNGSRDLSDQSSPAVLCFGGGGGGGGGGIAVPGDGGGIAAPGDGGGIAAPGDGGGIAAPGDGGGGDDGCVPTPASCDENQWLNNVFETAYPDCAAGGGSASG